MDNTEVVKLIRRLRSEARRKRKTNLIAAWSEKDRMGDEVVDSFVVIFRTSGCKWAKISGCSMCGYYNDTSPDIEGSVLLEQLGEAMKKYRGEKLVKIYTSGSFFDPNEIPVDVQDEILSAFPAERIIVESRPEFVRDDVAEAMAQRGNVMVALGLESASDETLLFRINKGFLVRHYVRAAETLNAHGVPVKSYVLLKPPFMTEAEAIDEAIMSVEFASRYSELVSVNPMNIQNNTLVEYLWKRGEYRPPWLWSVVEVLKRTYSVDADVVSYPTAGGTKRGAHNCGKCDERVVKAIYDFSLHQELKYLEALDCACRERWKKIVKYGPAFWDYTVES